MTASKKPAFALVTEGTKLNTLIKSIGTRSKTLDRDIHIAGLSALWHGFEHKSTGYAEELLKAMGKSSRKNALRAWLLDMGCFMVKDDGKTLGIDKERHSAGWAMQTRATETPFWEHNKEPEVLTQVDAMEAVRKLIERLSRAQSKGQLDSVGVEVLAKVKQLAPSFETNAETHGKAATKPERELAEVTPYDIKAEDI